MIELFGAATGNCFRAAIALEEAGVAYVPRKVDLGKNEQLGDAYRIYNPVGRVPFLVDTDGPHGYSTVITQSNAIMLYAAEKTATLQPVSGAERLRAIEWLFFFVTDVIGPSNQASFLESSGGDGAVLLTARALSMYQHVERRLKAHPFLAGDSFTIADIAAYTITRWLDPAAKGDFPNLTRWFETVGARPGVRRGLAAFR